MDPLTAPKAGADARDYLAEERTFLAWIRTGLAVMAFGFVVARFGLFLHIALDDFRVVRDNLAGMNRTTRDRMIPSCLFTDPQVAHIGLTEIEAGRQGIAVRVLKLPMAAVLRTRTIDESRGFMKALIEAEGDRILGFTMIGPEAGEVMAVVQMAMLAGLPYTALRDAILTHPTMAEGLNSLFASVKQPTAA
jgi:pyruvate/2-oxoglutarate dehydrogenase complex dihydrolipoamide dehydrogenase (E3) component